MTRWIARQGKLENATTGLSQSVIDSICLGLRQASDGDEIEVVGKHVGFTIGSGKTGYLHDASKPGGIFGIRVFGTDDQAEIGSVMLMRSGWQRDLTFEDLVVRCTGQTGFITTMLAQKDWSVVPASQVPPAFTDLALRRLRFIPARNAQGAVSTKWYIRLHGPASGVIEACEGTEAQEYLVYWDNQQGNLRILNNKAVRCGRGLCQGTNRKESGPCDFGLLEIRGNIAEGCGTKAVSGGNAFISAGHQGDTVIEGNVSTYGYDAYAPHGTMPFDGRSSGGVNVWFEGPVASKGKLGAYKDAEGFSSQRVTIARNRIAHKDGDRSLISVNGAREVAFGSNLLKSNNKPGIEIDLPGNGRPCGESYFTTKQPAADRGWMCVPKARKNKSALSDAAINAMYRPVVTP